MKKKHLLFAAAAMAMAGCANDTDLSSGNSTAQGDGAIAFNLTTPATTRSELSGNNAAEKLNKTFFVWGEKNEGATGNTITNNVAAENTVFQNYTVSYTDGSANTTTSNTKTKGWEYVGLTSTVSSENLTPQTPSTQTIKYWDASADDYTFTAVSALSSDITDGNVKIEKKTAAPTDGTKYDKGYDITVKTMDAAANVYVADRVNITKPTSMSTTNEENKYGGYVKFTFRNFQSKIRFGIFENVPGYKVIITKIKGKETTQGSTTSSDKEYTPTDKGFGVTVANASIVEAGDNTKYSITYEPKVGENQTQQVPENRVKFTVDNGATKVDYLNTGGDNWLSTTFSDWTTSPSTNKFIGESASDATYDKTATEDGKSNAKAYTAILPNPDNTSDMTLTISYTLISEDTGEKIEVNDKSVTVPHEYCQWKPNFAYTYLFKITEQSADLYPITFDAVVVENETGKQETITTVDEPSWTVFATDANGSAYKTIDNEFTANDIIYATLLKSDNSIAELTSSNAKLYTVTTTSNTNYPITEGSVANAIKQNNNSSNVKATQVTTENFITYTSEVPTEDGNKITLTGNQKVMKWTAAASTVYAIEYTDGDTKTYKVIKIGGATGETTTVNP